MRFGFLILKLSCAVLLFAAAGSSAKTVAQKAEPTPAINQSSAQLAEEKAAGEKSENKSNEKAAPGNASVRLEELIHLGDVIDVDVLGSLEYDWRGRLDDEGFLSAIPFLKEPVFGLCRSEEELASNLAEAYSKFLRKPEVVVRVVDRTARQQARIFGAVRTPLRLQIERPVHLNEILILTGGIGERASGEIKIFRPAYLSCNSPQAAQAESQTITIKITDLLAGKAEANPFVRTGDIVTVEEAKPIFVAGGVAAPQTIFLRDNQTMTLTRAVASAGGAIKNAVKATIFRRAADGTTQLIETDLEKIRKKQSEDISLEAFDIVEIEGAPRADKTKPPIIAGVDANQSNQANLPLRIVN